jgi:hypothetical protein
MIVGPWGPIYGRRVMSFLLIVVLATLAAAGSARISSGAVRWRAQRRPFKAHGAGCRAACCHSAPCAVSAVEGDQPTAWNACSVTQSATC